MTNPLDLTVETEEQVTKDLVEAARWIAKDQLGATGDCRFNRFSIDEKPKHGTDSAREVAMKKIRAKVKGVRTANERLGI